MTHLDPNSFRFGAWPLPGLSWPVAAKFMQMCMWMLACFALCCVHIALQVMHVWIYLCIGQCSLPPTLQWTMHSHWLHVIFWGAFSSAAALSSARLPRRGLLILQPHYPVQGYPGGPTFQWGLLILQPHYPVQGYPGGPTFQWGLLILQPRYPVQGYPGGPLPVGAALVQYSRTIQCTTTTFQWSWHFPVKKKSRKMLSLETKQLYLYK